MSLIQIPPTEFMERENVVCTGFKVKIPSLQVLKSKYYPYHFTMRISAGWILSGMEYNFQNKQTNKKRLPDLSYMN